MVAAINNFVQPCCPDDSIFLDRNFEEWVEGEMLDMQVAMEVDPGTVYISGQDGMTLGLSTCIPESYATPGKALRNMQNEQWGPAISSHGRIENWSNNL